MIIYGFRDRESIAGAGEFPCPCCKVQRPYALVSVKRWFTLYFLPLFPTYSRGRFVKCYSCGQTFGEEFAHGANPFAAHQGGPLPATSHPAPQPFAAVGAAPVHPVMHEPAPSSGMGITSLVLGILSPFLFFLCGASFFSALAAVITGHMAIAKKPEPGGRAPSHGAAIGGLVLGYMFLALSPIAMYVAYFVYQNVQYAKNRSDQYVNRPHSELTGPDLLSQMETEVISSSGGAATGNSDEAKKLAQEFSDQIQEVREAAISKANKGIKLSGDKFVTSCELTKDSCTLIVHVPEFRRYTDDAKEFICDMAWEAAQHVAEKRIGSQGKLALGLKGVLVYGGVMIGECSGDPTHRQIAEVANNDPLELFLDNAAERRRQDEAIAATTPLPNSPPSSSPSSSPFTPLPPNSTLPSSPPSSSTPPNNATAGNAQNPFSVISPPTEVDPASPDANKVAGGSTYTPPPTPFVPPPEMRKEPPVAPASPPTVPSGLASLPSEMKPEIETDSGAGVEGEFPLEAIPNIQWNFEINLKGFIGGAGSGVLGVSPDGKYVAAAPFAKLAVFDVKKRILVAEAQAPPDLSSINTLTFTENNQRLFLGEGMGGLQAWDFKPRGTLTAKTALQSHAGGIHAVALRDDASFVLSGGGDGLITWQQIRSGKAGAVKQVRALQSNVKDLYLPDKGLNFLATDGQRIIEVDMKTETVQSTVELGTFATYAAFSSDGAKLALWDPKGLCIVDAKSGKPLALHKSSLTSMGKLCWLPGRSTILAPTLKGLAVFDEKHGFFKVISREQGSSLSSISTSKDGAVIAVSGTGLDRIDLYMILK